MELDEWTLTKIYGSDDSKAEDPAFLQYVQYLGNLNASQIEREPERLANERASIQEETENLAFSNYKTFIEAANTSKEIYTDFTLIDARLDSVLQLLPSISERCAGFLSEAQKMGERRAKNTATLSKYPQLIEILEMPQVMDTCVRAGCWEEALELAQYVGKLQRRLPHMAVIQSVGKDVAAQRRMLLDQLLDQLNTQLSLQQCIRVVTYLRRLAVFTETELRIKFLLAREQWFESLLAAIPTADAYQHISEVMEKSRVHLFDICTQYRAAFADDDAPTAEAPRDQLPTNTAAVFHAWLFGRVDAFVETLRADVRRGVGERLDSVLANAMYFGLSFGRVGADFRALLCPVFEDAARDSFRHALDNAVGRLLTEMRRRSFLDECRLERADALALAAGATELSPPSSLMACQPLAVFCNEILSALNDVRHCLPLTVAEYFAELLSAALRTVVADLDVMARDEKAQHDVALALLRLVVDDLTLFLNRCLEALFPRNELAEKLGLSSFDHRELCRIPREALRESTLLATSDAEVEEAGSAEISETTKMPAADDFAV